MPKKTNKTPAQRAQDQYDVADRKVKRLSEKHGKAQAELAEAELELSGAVTERNAYAALRDAFNAGGKGAKVAETPPMTAEES